VSTQKTALDWNEKRWAAELQKCNGVYIEIDQPFMHQLVQLVATDLGLRWAASAIPNMLSGREQSYLPKGWESFDCIASTTSIIAKPGQTLLWLGKDRSIIEYFKAPTADLEFGTKYIPGVLSLGVYDFESTARGPLRWTSQLAHFEAPNNPAAPAKALLLDLWPMPLSADLLKISVNGDTIYNGVPPSSALTMPLNKFAAQDKLTIELQTSAVTHYPNDPRDLGVAIKKLRLRK
jgi:hypothetical protein